MKIGVTGLPGSGKTTFAEFLSKDRILLISGDEEGKRILEQNKQDIFNTLGLTLRNDYLLVLRNAIKSKREILKVYNKWMYKHIIGIIKNKTQNEENVIVDAALIFEWGIEKIFDRVIYIKTEEFGKRFKRISKERNVDRELYLMLESYQLKGYEKEMKSDIIINNENSINDLEENAYELYEKLFNNHYSSD
ncbi:dephospho-CoA kinase [candidate division WOR-3 bacterium]|nr:dephospho-CoA kinase [candidate division WOR-3 bacterium]